MDLLSRIEIDGLHIYKPPIRVDFPYISQTFLCLMFSPFNFPYISHIFPIYFPYISNIFPIYFPTDRFVFCWPHDLRHPDAVLGAMLKLTFIPTARSCGVYSIVLGGSNWVDQIRKDKSVNACV